MVFYFFILKRKKLNIFYEKYCFWLLKNLFVVFKYKITFFTNLIVYLILLQASKIGLGPAHPFFCHNGEQLGTQPPPAHMGIPPYQLDKAPGEYIFFLILIFILTLKN